MSFSVCLSKVNKVNNSLFKKLLLSSHSIRVGDIRRNRNTKLWTPSYFEHAKKRTTEYDSINFQIKGYDFTILESYQLLIKKIANILNIEVTKTWGTPCESFCIHKYFDNSTNIETKYNLNLYERNVQVTNVKSNLMSLLLEAVSTSCPPGVSLKVHKHSGWMEKQRYSVDPEITELKNKLNELKSDKKKKS